MVSLLSIYYLQTDVFKFYTSNSQNRDWLKKKKDSNSLNTSTHILYYNLLVNVVFYIPLP